MLNIRQRFKNLKASKTFRIGGYSMLMAVLFITAIIIINLIVAKIPVKYTRFDITDDQLFNISKQTERVLTTLDKDIDIFWIVQDGSENIYIEEMLSLYSSCTSHINVVKKDPVLYPNFATQYTSETLYENSMIVVCGKNSRVINTDNIFTYGAWDSYTEAYSITFDGESWLTSAISYVSSDDLPIIYALSGHNESSLDDNMLAASEKQNLFMQTISLEGIENIPSDCDCLFILNPQTDISNSERDIILRYLKSGGNMMLITNYVDENGLPNLESVMEYYGIKAQTGIVIEGDSNYYLSEYVYYLMPDITSHAITAPIIEAGYDFIIPVAQGLIISENVRDSLSVISLFDTSGKSYSKTEGYSITTYEKEENDIDGPFSLGATVTEGDTNIVWLSSAMFLDDTANEYSNGANEDVFLNSLNWLCGIEDGITIHSKNLSSEHLTISSAAKSILTFVFVIFVPLALLSAGIITAVIRRRRG